MRLSENRAVAWAVLAICAVGSVFGLGGAAIARDEKAVLKTFYSGAAERDAGHCMDAYLNRIGECASIMASEVQLYLGDNADAQKMLDQVAFIGSDDSLESRAAAYWDMRTLADRLYNLIYAAEITDAERTNFKRAYDDFWGAARFIEKDTYHELADAYNQEFSEGLASLAGGLHGAGMLCDSFD